MEKFNKIDLAIYYNNNGFNNNKHYKADFTCKGLMGRYPQEEMPNSKEEVFVRNIPFKFPSHDIEFNNVELQGQQLNFQAGKYKKIHILSAADTGSFKEKINISSIDNHSIVKSFGVTDWMAPQPYYNDKLAYRFSKSYSIRGVELDFKPAIWYQVISLEDYNNEINSIKFRDNPSVHIFSLTLELWRE